jgi:hydrogenase maturation protease
VTWLALNDEDVGQREWSTVVAGFGSPHGDDQAGWRVAAMLLQRPRLGAHVLAVKDPTQVLAALRSAERLIAIDACQGSGVAGTVTRHVWPDVRIAARHSHSTHGIAVADALRLAEKLGSLPPQVDVWGIEVADCSPGQDLTPQVVRAVAEVASKIVTELSESADA